MCCVRFYFPLPTYLGIYSTVQVLVLVYYSSASYGIVFNFSYLVTWRCGGLENGRVCVSCVGA